MIADTYTVCWSQDQQRQDSDQLSDFDAIDQKYLEDLMRIVERLL